MRGSGSEIPLIRRRHARRRSVRHRRLVLHRVGVLCARAHADLSAAIARLLPELADFFERSFRAQNQVSDFTILESTPTDIGGRKGLAVRYRYTLPNDELTRLGEARMAVVEGKLYVTNFYAPQLHYFDAGLPEAHAIMERTRF